MWFEELKIKISGHALFLLISKLGDLSPIASPRHSSTSGKRPDLVGLMLSFTSQQETGYWLTVRRSEQRNNNYREGKA